jgi:low affinity Fe/Cu permease
MFSPWNSQNIPAVEGGRPTQRSQKPSPQGALEMTKAHTKKLAPTPNGHRPNVHGPHSNGHAFNRFFARFAQTTAHAAGTPTAFLLATVSIILWAATGPLFGFSDTWQLVINTGTTIITFLMVFLIQNTQNRDSVALQLKLGELIIAMKGAENSIAAVEELSEEELEQLHKDLLARAQATSDALQDRRGRKR